jgi:hypothetical protein
MAPSLGNDKMGKTVRRSQKNIHVSQQMVAEEAQRMSSALNFVNQRMSN